jgi:hypothetical protein
MINVFLAGLPTLLLSTPTSMLMTLIHSEQLSAKQALTKMKAQHFKAYVDIYRSSIVTMSIFFCIRQQLIENEQYVFQRKLRMTEKAEYIGYGGGFFGAGECYLPAGGGAAGEVGGGE